MQISWRICPRKNFKNRLEFDELTAMSLVSRVFAGHGVVHGVVVHDALQFCAVIVRLLSALCFLQWSGVVSRTLRRSLVIRLFTMHDAVSTKSRDSNPRATITSECAPETSKDSGRPAPRWSAFLQVRFNCFCPF